MEEEYEQIDLLRTLLDPNNRDPLTLRDEKGRTFRFEQVAVVPYGDEDAPKLYAVLKPLDKIEGIGDDEAIVFVVDFDDEGNAVIKVEDDEDISQAVFDKYYELLEKARKENEE